MTASGQFLKLPDTLCFSLPEAKRLAYIKLNFQKLDSTNRIQAQMIRLLNKSLESKRKMLDVAYMKIENLTQQNALLESKLKKIKQIYQPKKTFWQKAQPYIYGFVAGAAIITVVRDPP